MYPIPLCLIIDMLKEYIFFVSTGDLNELCIQLKMSKKKYFNNTFYRLMFLCIQERIILYYFFF